MREYILTPRERRILITFIKKGAKLDGFSVLIIRLRRASSRLKEDLALIEETLRKLRFE